MDFSCLRSRHLCVFVCVIYVFLQRTFLNTSLEIDPLLGWMYFAPCALFAWQAYAQVNL